MTYGTMSSDLTCINLELRGERSHDKKTISKAVAKYFLHIILKLLNPEIHKVLQSSKKKKRKINKTTSRSHILIK